MTVRLITGPSDEPVSLAEARAHVRLDTDLDNPYLTTAIKAARHWAEKYTNRGLMIQTLELVLEGFPGCDEVELPRGQLAVLPEVMSVVPPAVSSVKYIDAAGDEQTLPTTEYVIDSANVPGKVRLAYGKSWPEAREQWDAVKIRYAVGWAAATVPEDIKQAILLLVSQMYEQRTPEVSGTIISKVSFAVEALLGHHRIFTL